MSLLKTILKEPMKSAEGKESKAQKLFRFSYLGFQGKVNETIFLFVCFVFASFKEKQVLVAHATDCHVSENKAIFI